MNRIVCKIILQIIINICACYLLFVKDINLAEFFIIICVAHYIGMGEDV